MRITFKGIEEMMIRNIANTLFQLHFHQHATPEELQEYYGWDEAFEEQEREKLIADTVKRLKAEQLVLRFYKKNIIALNTKYDYKDATGDFDLPAERPTGDSPEPGSLGEDAGGDDEGGPEPRASGDTGPRDADTKAGDSEDAVRGDEEEPGDGSAEADDARGHDRGGRAEVEKE